MALERPYDAQNKTDCVDFVRAADHNRQEEQLEALTALVPISFNLPQFDLDPDTGVVLVRLEVPADKKVCKAVLGVALTDGSGPDTNLIVRLEHGSNEVQTSADYEEFDLSPCAEEGDILFGTVENLEVTGSTKTCIAHVTLFVEPA